nr:hypothetical protein [Tanacetum cinerariifolium]
MFAYINKSSAEYTEDNSNDEDNEDSHLAKEEQNTKDSDSIKNPLIKKRGRLKKIVRANENKSSYVKRRGRPRKNNDESKKQTLGSKRKEREYKVEDDDDNDRTKRMKKKMDHKEAKVKRKRNQKNTKRKIVDDSSFEFKVTTTSSKALFNAMAILNVDRKKCLYEMSFGSMIGMAIHELPGMLETTTSIDNDDTTGIDKESDSPNCQMESDSPASDNDNQKSDFQVLFHKESGNSDLQRMKNKERNEDVHHILNEDDKVDDSCPATGVCSVIEGDEVKLKGKGVKFIENENVLVDDVPNELIKCSFEVQKKYSLNECDDVIQDENKAIVQDSVERSEHTLEKEKKKISNEELRSQSLKGNVGAEVAVDSQHTIEDIFKQDEQIQSAE